MSSNSVLVTGAAGFIGFHLSYALLKRGKQVIGIDNINDYYAPALKKSRLSILQKDPAFTFYQIDIAQKKPLIDLFQSYSFDYVLHLAAQAGVQYSLQNPDSYTQSNLIGFMNILEAIRQFPPKHTLYASSSSIYGNDSQIPFSITQKTDTPISLYAATKKSNELLAYSYASMYDLHLTGLRFFTVYGPFGRPDMAYFKFTQSILKGEPLTLYNYGNMHRDFTYIDDIIQAIILCMDLPFEKNRLLNIGNHTPENIETLIHYIELFLEKKAIKEYAPTPTGDVEKTFADITDLKKLTGFIPTTPLKEGVKTFIDWYKQYYCA